MNRNRYLLLFFLGLFIGILTAAYQDAPGYMDADYYFIGGLRLTRGEGFSELVLWNYLDNPTELPHPSHGYWMPLASIISWFGLKISLFQNIFKDGQTFFILILAFIPPVTASLSYSFNKYTRTAMFAGLLACLPAFYLPFLTTTDTFGLYMLLGALFFLLINNTGDHQIVLRRSFLMGLVAGLMHLARQDGLLWLGIAGLVVIYPLNRKADNQRRFAALSRIIFGYLLVMGPWFLRNWIVFGSWMAPGGSQTLWLTEYNELFSFPASTLTPEHWLQSGVGNIIQARVWAFGQNLQTFIAVQGSIFLFPLILLGAWHLRKDNRIRFASLVWMITFIVMTLFFPFSGVRGGFFHSGAALQPLFWALVPVGLNTAIKWANQKRGWNILSANFFFQVSFIVFAFGLTSFIFSQRLLGSGESQRPWGSSEAHYSQLEKLILEKGALLDEVVMVNNPPGFFTVSDRSAIVIPNGTPETLLAAAEKYSARFVLLEADHPVGLDELYESQTDQPGLVYLGVIGETHIYKFENSH